MAIHNGLRSALEERVVSAVAAERDQLIALAGELISYHTTARMPGVPPRDEAKLQDQLRLRLMELGAEVDLWEPEPTGKGNPYVPIDLDFRGRPQLAARLAGSGGDRACSLTVTSTRSPPNHASCGAATPSRQTSVTAASMAEAAPT